MVRFLVKHKWFILITLFLIGWSVVLFFHPPDEIASTLGLKASYALMLFTALVGVSGFFSAPFYAMLVTFASTGEFNPIFLGLTLAPARVLGDSLFFLWGLKGRHLVEDVFKTRLNGLMDRISRVPHWAAPVVAFIYTATTPLPQDVLMVTLGALGVRFWKVFLAVVLGNAAFISVIVFVVSITSN